MVSQVADAALEVDASASFPVVFPYVFSPQARMTRGAVANTSTVITATTSGTSARQLFASAVLAAGVADTLPYTLPWTLGQLGPPKAELLMATTINASRAITLTPTNASFTSTGTSAWTCSASLAVTAAVGAPTMHRVVTLNASMPVTASRLGTATRGQKASSSLAVTATRTAIQIKHSMASASLVVTATRASVVGKVFLANASLGLTATTPSNLARKFFASASLVITIHDTFPYTFPYVFDISTNTAIIGLHPHAALVVNAVTDVKMTRNVIANAALAITTSLPTAGISGGEHPGDVALVIGATTVASMRQGSKLNSALAVTAARAAVLRGRVSANVALEVDTSTAVHLRMTARLVTNLVVQFSALINAPVVSNIGLVHLGVTASVTASGKRGQFLNAHLDEILTHVAGANHNLLVGASLTVHAAPSVSFPESMPFWPYYLR